MGARHALYSASACHRWSRCPGSLKASEGAPRTSSTYADRGTAVHALCEDWLLFVAAGWDVDDYIPDAKGFEVDGVFYEWDSEAMDNARLFVRTCVDAVGPNPQWFSAEREVNYASALGVEPDKAFGTSDFIGLSADGKRLVIVDYKNGREDVPVKYVDNKLNEQPTLYGAGALLELPPEQRAKVETIELVIVQPNAETGEQVRRAEVSVPQLWSRVGDFKYAVGLTQDLNPRRIAGDKQCRWCPVKATCAERRAFELAKIEKVAKAQEALGLFDAKSEEQLSNELLGELVAQADAINAFVSDLRKELERRVLAGKKVPGWKLVRGRQGNRKWVDEADAEAKLRALIAAAGYTDADERIFEKSLISPTAADKVVKAIDPRQSDTVKTLWTRAEGKLGVAPADDPAPEVEAPGLATAADFDGL